MLDVMRTSLARIHHIIPEPILEACFKPHEYDVSIDEIIKQKVIESRVLDDVSQRCGKIMDIVLQLDWTKYTAPPSNFTLAVSGAFSTFAIPPEAREFKDILCVMQIRFPYTLSRGGSAAYLSDAAVAGNTAGSLACAALQNQTRAGLLAMPTGIVLPGNVIQLKPETISWTPWIVSVRLKYDSNFSGMDINSVATFNQVCEMATKAYIYKELMFQIETNTVYKGMELGVIKDIVNGYSDANEKYDELLIALGGVQRADPLYLQRILSKCMPSA